MGIYPLSNENDEQLGNRFFRRMRWGAVAFFVATPVLAFIACPAFLMVACQRRNNEAAVVAASIVELALLVMLFTGRRTWRFTVGFFLAYLVSATFTRGAATVWWTMPGSLAIDAASPLWQPAVAHQQENAAKQQWVGIKRTQHPAIVHAARLANLVGECARQAMLADSINSYPRSAAELIVQAGCESLSETQFSADSTRSRYSESDNGWRWGYVPGPQDPYGRVMTYAVDVSEDKAIDRPNALKLTSDEKGMIVEQAIGAAPRTVASPVASLVTMRKCLLRVPAANAALRASSPYLGRSSPMNSLSRVCPELAHHIASDYPDHDENRGRLALPAHDQAAEFPDTVALYITQFTAADVDGAIFELRAWPARARNPAVRAGVRQFFVARDGSIHVTVGDQPPTANDPIAAECLPGGGVDCGVAEAPPSGP